MSHRQSRTAVPRVKSTERKINRREVLTLLAGGLGFSLAGIGALKFGQWLPEYEEKKELQRLFEERMKTPLPVSIVPEYERFLDHALMVFDNFCFADRGGDATKQELLQRQYQELKELIRVFPKYTTVHMTASASLEQAMREQIATLPPDVRRRIVPCPIGTTYGGEFISGRVTKSWAQDVCELVSFEGKPAILMPLNRSYEPGAVITALRNTSMPSLEKQGFHHFLAPIIFDGGNVIPTKIRERTYLFIGSTDVGRTIAFYDTALGIPVSEKEATELFKNSFGVDEVVVFGPTLEDYINMADSSGGAFETYQEIKKRATPGATIVIVDKTGQKLLSVFDEGNIVFWFGDIPYQFENLKTGGVLEQGSFSYHLDMVMTTHPGDRISLVDIEPFTKTEIKERGRYYEQVYTAKGLTGTKLTKAIESDFFRDYLFLNYTISELRKAQARLTAIYGKTGIFRFPSSALHARNHQAYANTLRFKDRTTGKHRAIMPLFPTQERWVQLVLAEEGYSSVTRILDTGKEEKYEDRGHNRIAREHLEGLGYDVSSVRNTTYHGDGNTNCLVNILS